MQSFPDWTGYDINAERDISMLHLYSLEHIGDRIQ